MSAPTVDIIAQGLSRLASQYSDRTKIRAYVEALLAVYQELEDVLQFMALQTDIDIAEGVNLDIIGEIVGVSRIIPDSIAVQFFGFEGQPGATIFGEKGQVGIGARFREENESETDTTVLADPEYRLLIRAKIVKNHGHGTGEDILKGLIFLFNAPLTLVEDHTTMAIRVSIGRQLTYQEKAIVKQLDILPRPAGVRIDYLSTFDVEGYFGFDENPGAKPFGEEGDTTIGGTFAEEF